MAYVTTSSHNIKLDEGEPVLRPTLFPAATATMQRSFTSSVRV